MKRLYDYIKESGEAKAQAAKDKEAKKKAKKKKNTAKTSEEE